MALMRGANAVSGRMCSVEVIINGTHYDLGMIKTFEASVEKSDTEINTLRGKWTQHKGGVLSGSWSMTQYFGSPVLKRILKEFSETGIDTYFTALISNNDPGSDAGAQTIALYDCNITSIQPAKADVDSDALEEDVEGTFAGWQFIGEFNE